MVKSIGIALVAMLVIACGGSAPASVAAPPNASTPAAVPTGAAATTAPAASTTPSAIPAAGGANVTAIAAGTGHACALLDGGAVMCWGTNFYGQLGGGAKNANELPPVGVEGLSGADAIAAAADYSCALTAAGGVKCWGRNVFGTLGVGSVTDSITPVDVTGLTGDVTAISAGDNHACAVTSAGGVKCWGFNDAGQLGNGSTVNSAVPVDVAGLSSGVVAVAASGGEANREGGFTCALLGSGGVKCWGGNGYGQLGNGTKTGSPTPVDVVGLASGVSQIDAGSGYACAVTTAGGAKCWGGSNVVPTDVAGLTSGVSQVATGKDRRARACAVAAQGAVTCWEDGNGAPVADPALTSDVASIAVRDKPCVLTTAHVAKCLSGTTGVGYAPVEGLAPTTGQGPSGSFAPSGGGSGSTAAISAGRDTTCAIAGGGAWCWGLNNFGQAGTGSSAMSVSAPTAVAGLASGVSSIVAADGYACALTDAGSVKCWGHNDRGQLGNGSTVDSLIPVDVTGLGSGVSAIAAGPYGACALTASGGVSCWGTTSNAPVAIGGLPGVKAIAVGAGFACALTTPGSVMCWGGNAEGELGDGSTVRREAPVAVAGLTGATALVAGAMHACALIGGGVKCWGDNHSGQLGTTPLTQPLYFKTATPVDVAGLTSGVTALAAGAYDTCAITSSGGATCWGVGMLGNGQSAELQHPDPVGVTGLTSGVRAIASGTSHMCALTDAGLVKCWGDNATGALGVGASLSSATTPVDVIGLP